MEAGVVTQKKSSIKPRKHTGFFREIFVNRSLYLLTLPGILYVLLNNYIPMFGIIIAFKKVRYGSSIFETYFKTSKWSGFKNFEFFLKTDYAYIITRNTVLYNIVFIFLGAALAVALAITLNEVKNRRLAKLYQSVIILPHFLSWVIIGFVVYTLLNPSYGLINKSILPALGMQPIDWYMEPKYWPLIIPLTHFWQSLGWGSIVYLASIAGISAEYYEAATIDGASKWQQITKITVPLLKPMITTMILLSLGGIFHANFGLFYNVPRESGALFNVTNVIDTYVYRALSNTGDIEMAAAAGLYQSVVGFSLVIITNAVVRKLEKDNALF